MTAKIIVFANEKGGTGKSTLAMHTIIALLRAGKKELKSPAVPAVDTLRYARKAFPEFGKYKLSFLAEKLCINPGNAHRALDDALTCMNLFLKCISRAELLQDQ